MALVMGGSSPVPLPLTVDDSCRFNDGDSPQLEITPGSTTDAIRKTWTFSVWFKLGSFGDDAGTRHIIFPRADASNYDDLWLQADDTLSYTSYTSGSTSISMITTQTFRDPAAWYHLVVAVDTTIASPAADRVKIYINGTQVTSFSTETYPSQDDVTMMNSDSLTRIGNNDGSDYYDGYFSQLAMVTASQLAATSFGEFDTDSPTIWKPKKISGLTFGTNGYYLDFADSADFGNDVSGNGNDWSSSGLTAADAATDTPTNNFCVMNILNQKISHPATVSQGNCKLTAAGDWGSWSGSMGALNGKWYFEGKRISPANHNVLIGVLSENATQNNTNAGNNYLLGNASQYQGCGVFSNNGNSHPGSGASGAAYGTAYGNGVIVGVAFDLDNEKIYFSNAGTWMASGDPESGATGTGSMTNLTQTTEFYFPAVGPYYNVTPDSFECNFGGCSAFDVASANQDANGYGNFEYAVPAGYYSLCSKNLEEFG
tara:strand:- start:559 stop:2013 length:1455 start_codon:yes stop_codon:yes gene_type:complete